MSPLNSTFSLVGVNCHWVPRVKQDSQGPGIGDLLFGCGHFSTRDQALRLKLMDSLPNRGIIKGILACGRDPESSIAVFRIPGSWEEEGQKILNKYGVVFSDRHVSIDQAAQIAVDSM